MTKDPRLYGHTKRRWKGVTLHRRRYFLWREDWDHDHCEFCWKTLLIPGAPLQPDEVTEGWTTDDEYSWICDACFKDFHERFGWKLRDPLPTDRPETPWPQPTVPFKGMVEK